MFCSKPLPIKPLPIEVLFSELSKDTPEFLETLKSDVAWINLNSLYEIVGTTLKTLLEHESQSEKNIGVDALMSSLEVMFKTILIEIEVMLLKVYLVRLNKYLELQKVAS